MFDRILNFIASHSGNSKDALDHAAGVGAFGAWLGYLPEVAAGFAILWYIVRLYEWARTKMPQRDD